MAKTPLALLLLGALAFAHPVAAAPRSTPSARLTVGASVVRSCQVDLQDSGSVGVRCTRGTTDRVLVAATAPRIVMLERDGATMRTSIQSARRSTAAETDCFVTLQF